MLLQRAGCPNKKEKPQRHATATVFMKPGNISWGVRGPEDLHTKRPGGPGRPRRTRGCCPAEQPLWSHRPEGRLRATFGNVRIAPTAPCQQQGPVTRLQAFSGADQNQHDREGEREGGRGRRERGCQHVPLQPSWLIAAHMLQNETPATGCDLAQKAYQMEPDMQIAWLLQD